VNGGTAPGVPNYQALIQQQQGINTGQFQQQIGAGRVGQTTPYASTGWQQDPTTGQWTQNTALSGGTAGVVNPALAGAGAAASAFNPANNPTYGGPQNAGNLSFNPAGVAQNLYQSQLGLLEPGMQSQASALDQSLKAQGYDVNQAGGAQTAENNLQNQQNLVRAQTANWAAGQAIPQGAQQLAAQESIPLTQQQVAQGAFGAGLQQAQLPISEATGLTNIGLAPANALPGGTAPTPGLPPINALDAGQQQYANQVGGYNANLASNANQLSGLLGLGDAGLGAYAANPKAFNNLASGIGGAVGNLASGIGGAVGNAGSWLGGLLGF